MLSVKTVSSSAMKEVSLNLLLCCLLLLLSTLSGAGSPLQPDGCYENERLRMGLQVAKSLLQIGVSLYTSFTVQTWRALAITEKKDPHLSNSHTQLGLIAATQLYICNIIAARNVWCIRITVGIWLHKRKHTWLFLDEPTILWKGVLPWWHTAAGKHSVSSLTQQCLFVKLSRCWISYQCHQTYCSTRLWNIVIHLHNSIWACMLIM